MAKLIVCLDGTWNGVDDSFPTNVKKIYDLIDGETKRLNKKYDLNTQFKYYHPGVGDEGTVFEKFLGGAIAVGIESIIKSSYAWLGRNYRKDDKIYIFGFSRGAFAATVLSDIITKIGLLDLSKDDRNTWKMTDEIFSIYEEGNFNFSQEWNFHSTSSGKNEIEFLGVWDTVEAYIDPDSFGTILSKIRTLGKSSNKKCNTRLLGNDFKINNKILNARHALALDEKRIPFTPLIWKDVISNDKRVQQIWFSGVHCDIGGGYEDSSLSDITLKWMVEEILKLENTLSFRPKMREYLMNTQIVPQSLIHDSYTTPYKLIGAQPRSIPQLIRDGKDRNIHLSVFKRLENPPLGQGDYRVQRQFDPETKSITLNIYASKEWNETGIYIEKNRFYRFTTSGEWFDGTHPYSVEGSENSLKEGRIKELPWFCMVGTVAMGGEATGDCGAIEYVPFQIKTETVLHSNWEGYLYCFANDNRKDYKDNKGRIELTIEILEEMEHSH